MSGRARRSAVVGLALWALAAAGLCAQPPQPGKPRLVAGLLEEQALVLGERMYRAGILPSGEPMRVVINGSAPVSATTYGCASCHLRSGLGSTEGGVVTLPVNGAKLAQSRYWKYPNLSPQERKNLRLQFPEARPPYTDQTLAQAIRKGIDPSGRALNAAMPRYDLKDQDAEILIHYLWTLSAQTSPGVEAGTIRFATVITDEVAPGDQEAMLVPMNNFVARHNTHSSGFANRMYLSMGGEEMNGGYHKLSLAVWRLKGAPGTWAAQLESYLAKEPVFALLGGLSTQDWKPIHAFCESHRLPCLLPLTDLPVVSDTDWYTLYFSKGYYQEGQTAARYLESLGDPGSARRVLQLVQDGPEGRELAAGFRAAWQELGQGAAQEIRLKAGKRLDAAVLRALLDQEKPTVVLLWSRPESLGALEALAAGQTPPPMVIASARLLGARAFEVPEKARAFTYLTYPYRDPKEEPAVSRYANSLLMGLSNHRPETRISTRTYSMLQIFQSGLIDMDRNLYRDNFLDRIGLLPDFLLPDYLRLSFGTGQRYAARGCFIMQLSPGPEPKLLRKSEWVIH